MTPIPATRAEQAEAERPDLWVGVHPQAVDGAFAYCTAAYEERSCEYTSLTMFLLPGTAREAAMKRLAAAPEQLRRDYEKLWDENEEGLSGAAMTDYDAAKSALEALDKESSDA